MLNIMIGDLISALSDPFILFSDDGKVVEVNQSFKSMFGDVRSNTQLAGITGLSIDFRRERHSSKYLFRIPGEGFFLLVINPLYTEDTFHGWLCSVLRTDSLPDEYIRQNDQTISLTDIMNIIPAFIFYKDLDNRYLRVNRQFANELGKTVDEVEDRTAFELTGSNAFAEKALALDRIIVETGKPLLDIIEPLTVRHLKWLKSSKYPILNKEGKVIGILGFSLDITKEKAAQDKIRFQANLLNSVRESIIATDLDGRIIYFGRGAEVLFPFREEQVIGQRIVNVIRPKDAERFQQRIKDTLCSGTSHSIEEYSGKRVFHAESTMSSISGPEDLPIALILTDRDIEENVQAQRRLAESEATYRNFVTQSSDGIFMFGQDGRLIEWNPAIEHITGYSIEEVKDKYIWEIQHIILPKELNMTVEHIRNAILNAIKSGADELDNGHITRTIVNRSGGTRKLMMKITRVDTGENILYAAIVKDVTELVEEQRKRLETESRYRQIVENVNDGLLLLDRYENILVWNRILERLTGIPAHEAVGAKMYDIRYELLTHEEKKHLSKEAFLDLYQATQSYIKNNPIHANTIETISPKGRPAHDQKDITVEVRFIALGSDELVCGVIREVSADKG